MKTRSCSKCANCSTNVTAEEGTTPRCHAGFPLFESIQFEVRMHAEMSSKWLCTNPEAVVTSKETVFEETWSEEDASPSGDMANAFEAELLNEINGHIINLEDETIEDEMLSAGFEYIESLGATKLTNQDNRWVAFSTIVRSIGLRLAESCPCYDEMPEDEMTGILDYTPGYLPDFPKREKAFPRTYVLHMTTEVTGRWLQDQTHTSSRAKLESACRVTFQRWESRFELKIPAHHKNEVWRSAAQKLLLAKEKETAQKVA